MAAKSLTKSLSLRQTFLSPQTPRCLASPRTSPYLQRTQTSTFSTSQCHSYPRDRNPNRGVSALRGTGLRQPVSMSKYPLPEPQLDRTKKTPQAVDPNHGLWGFFGPEKKALATPEEEYAHGRAWTVEELRQKSWEDLHSLWWVCAKERNRIATSNKERERLKAGYGQFEAENRDKTVRKTQQAIKHALTERWYAWEHARKLAMNDKTVDLTGEGPAYEPKQRFAYGGPGSASGEEVKI